MSTKIKIISISFLFLLVFQGKNLEKKEIQPYAENTWYWQFNGEPVLLLGASGDDNLFQWTAEKLIPHLNSMQKIGANYVRNTMSDRPDRGFELYPFLKLKNGKYDLEQWNDEYWKRFDFFLTETKKRNIIVQIEVWDRFDYSRTNWEPNPYNPTNNINYSNHESKLATKYPKHPGNNKQPFFFTTPKQRNNKTLLKFQEKFILKMLSYSLKHNHILYCIDNETGAEEKWGIYWAELISKKAKKEGVKVCITEMWDNWDLKTKHHKYTFDHPERYVFCDISQNNQKKGQVHWNNFQWVRNYISSQPRPLNTVKTYGANGVRFGNNQDGIDRFWRHIIGGVASARFHRPTAGLGLSKLAIATIKTVREIEEIVKFWNLTPDNSLLLNREKDEAYLTSKPGKTYILFFTNGGEVGLNLTGFDYNFNLKWINVQTGKTQSKSIIKGGKTIKFKAPSKLEWVAIINKI